MLDSIQLLTNVVDVNTFDISSAISIHAGSYPVRFIIRLYQSDKKDRYIPASGAILKVEFLRMDTIAYTPTGQTVFKYLSQPFANDPSIWSVDLTQADVSKIISGGVRVTLTEGTTIKVIFAKSTIMKYPNSDDIE
jgi:hypothetical protein